MEDWYKKWHFKIYQAKSVHTTFTLKLAPCPEVSLFGTQIPSFPNVKYLGLTLVHRLTWARYIKAKTSQLNSRLQMLKTLIVNNKHSKLNTKLLLYKSLLKSI